MDTHNLCLHGEIRKLSWYLFYLELCRLFRCAGWSSASLSTYAMRPLSAWPGSLYNFNMRHNMRRGPWSLVWSTKAQISQHADADQSGPLHIMKTHLYSFDPLKPHSYIVKLGFTEVYIIFLISAQKHRLWVLVTTRLYNFNPLKPHFYIVKLRLTEVYVIFLMFSAEIWKVS